MLAYNGLQRRVPGGCGAVYATMTCTPREPGRCARRIPAPSTAHFCGPARPSGRRTFTIRTAAVSLDGGGPRRRGAGELCRSWRYSLLERTPLWCWCSPTQLPHTIISFHIIKANPNVFARESYCARPACPFCAHRPDDRRDVRPTREPDTAAPVGKSPASRTDLEGDPRTSKRAPSASAAARHCPAHRP